MYQVLFALIWGRWNIKFVSYCVQLLSLLRWQFVSWSNVKWSLQSSHVVLDSSMSFNGFLLRIVVIFSSCKQNEEDAWRNLGGIVQSKSVTKERRSRVDGIAVNGHFTVACLEMRGLVSKLAINFNSQKTCRDVGPSQKRWKLDITHEELDSHKCSPPT